MIRCYIAGPMTGIKARNYPAFHREAARLRSLGFDVVSPAEINAGQEGEGWAECMKRDIAELVTCDAVQLLTGWEASRGASLEHQLALELGIKVYHPSSTLCNLDIAA